MQNLFKSLAVCFLLLLMVACSHSRLDIDVSDINVPKVKVNRLEKDLFSVNPDSIASETKKLVSKYGNFYMHFIKGFINDGGLADSSYQNNIKKFISDKDMKEAYIDCQKVYPDLDFLENDLTDIFKHYKFYFPEKKLPKVVTFMSGFNYSVLSLDSTIGIGLEMYLGEKNRFYNMLPQDVLPMYRRKNMNKQNMLPDCIKGWISTEFESKEKKGDFLSEIIAFGKVMYLMDALLPDVHDTLKMGYSKKQIDWCNQNEYNMWTYFIEQKIIYTTDYVEILKYTGDGPFTAVFNKESPARVGNWIGWQIVRAYMNKYPEITIEQLMKENDAQKILEKSKYKPGKL